ncbi:MAG: hypothetical protein QMC67_17065 [Candidatus Wallbacteria bacterium]
MVLPTANYNHYFNVKGDSELKNRLKLWIREHYSTVLGPEINLLDQPNGFELIESKLKTIMAKKGMAVPAVPKREVAA